MKDHLTEIEYKPCPFCGHNDIRVIFTEDYYAYTKCNKCGASGPEQSVMEYDGPSMRTHVIEQWNKRV